MYELDKSCPPVVRNGQNSFDTKSQRRNFIPSHVDEDEISPMQVGKPCPVARATGQGVAKTSRYGEDSEE